MPVEDFVLRDERTEDYGVDVSVEVLVSGKATNCRAQIQIKARSGLCANVDGSFSVPIDVANINYLMNGPCPVYVLYRPESKSLLFAFAQDEFRRLSEENSDWASGASFTIRFRRELSKDECGPFADRILREAQRHRMLRDAVASATPATRYRLEIAGNPETHSVLTPTDAEQLLRDHGLSLVSGGRAEKVFELLSLVPRAVVQRSGALLLVQGNAELATGHYISAQASIRRASAIPTDIGEENLPFLTYLRHAVDYAVGEITPQEFRNRCDEWRVDAPKHLSIQYDLARLWSRFGDPSQERTDELAHEMTRIVRGLSELNDAPAVLVQQVRMLQVFLDAGSATSELLAAAPLVREPSAWRHAYDSPPAEILPRVIERVRGWRSSMNDILAEVRGSGNAHLWCQALHARDTIEVFVLSQLKMAAVIVGSEAPTVADELFKRVRRTQEIAKRFDQQELELRSRLLESDLADLDGNRAKAENLAAQVLELAETLRYAAVARSAKRAVSRSNHQEMLDQVGRMVGGGILAEIANLTDEQMNDLVVHTMKLLRVPADRLPLVRDEILCQRTLGRLHFDFCQHLQLGQDPAYGTSEQTLWATKPMWRARCQLLNRDSAVSFEQWAAILDAFRSSACSGCSHRQPLPGPFEPSTAD